MLNVCYPKATHCVNRLSGHKGLEKTLFLMVSKIPKGILCFLLIFFSFMILFTSDFSLGGHIMGPHLEFHKMLCLVTMTQDLSYKVYHGYVRWLSRSRCLLPTLTIWASPLKPTWWEEWTHFLKLNPHPLMHCSNCVPPLPNKHTN